MKVMNEVFLSFSTREEYLSAVRCWKWNMMQLIPRIKSNKRNIRINAKAVAIPYENSCFFQIESMIDLANSQRQEISFAKTATQLLEIRRKMKKLAGIQRAKRLAWEKKNLITV